MKFTIKHEKKGRIRVHLFQKYMNFTQADTLQYYLENLDGVETRPRSLTVPVMPLSITPENGMNC